MELLGRLEVYICETPLDHRAMDYDRDGYQEYLRGYLRHGVAKAVAQDLQVTEQVGGFAAAAYVVKGGLPPSIPLHETFYRPKTIDLDYGPNPSPGWHWVTPTKRK